MSDFVVTVERISAIEPVEGADKIELAVVGEYRSIVAKGSFKPGDLAVYLPEASVLPEWLIERLNLVGKLSGSQKNRIKAIKLRGCLSQGIVYQVNEMVDHSCHVVRGAGNLQAVEVSEGDDVTEFLGVKKYDPMEAMDPALRKRFYGNCAYVGPEKTVRYDFENWKKYPNIFKDGDEVVITEKLHGTMCCFAYFPGLMHPDLPDDVFVYSKGLGARGNVFKWVNDDGTPADNVYLKAFHGMTSDSALAATVTERLAEGLYDLGLAPPETPIFLFGEVYGIGVQDLGYGHSSPTFRAFDLWVGTPQGGRFIDAADKYSLLDRLGIPTVPVLYRGPFNRETMLSLTDGKTTLGGGHIREGVVITSATEENVHRFGRKILKNVSGEYLTRKGNITEFQ
jgi:RNA ligase (TIGR02306 family)